MFFSIPGCFLPALLFSQAIDNVASFRNMNGESYFRFHYDNDFFTATDSYYTQGINFELVHPSIKRFPLTKTLLLLKNCGVKYGISIEHNAFTPSSIRHNEIIYTDRPFAACLLLKTFSVSADTMRLRRCSTVFSTGVIGQSAFGEEMQTSIHRWLKNIAPLGWKHQIKNDIILSYELSYEKQLYACRNLFLVNSNLQIISGTFKDNAGIGFTFTMGKFNSPFTSFAKKSGHNFQLYFYSQALLTFIAYDATLQGGVFNHGSPYILQSTQISRIVFQDNSGVVFSFKKIYLEYYQSYLTKEFKKGMAHKWSGIKIGLVI